MWCIVSLPNGTQQAVLCDPKAIGQECLEKVCKSLNMICEMEYFGLEHWSPDEKESRTRQWINLRNRLNQDSGSGHGTRVQLMLALRVKFWVPVHLILQESVRNIFFMQAKMDLVEGRLNAKDWKNAAKLGALCAQAEGLRFNVQCLTAKCPIRMKKDKELHVLAFKKRRLSKQKSLDNIEIPPPAHPEIDDEDSPLSVYKGYIIRPIDADADSIPDDFLRQIALEHEKLTKINMAPKSAKYWLLKEIQELPGFGEEVFTGSVGTEPSLRCDICVGPNGLVVCTGDEKKIIPFSAIAKGKSLRRTFKLEYINDEVEQKELEVKFPKHAMAAGVYRSITERHAFYVCDKVRVVVTSQFTRDLKGTIASMFKEDTELGKRYVFDIQRTCREVHDQARRILHERGIEINGPASSSINTTLDQYSSIDSIDVKRVDNAIKEKEYREAVIERFVDNRITEAMTCKICMDKEINTMFSPCGHVTACSVCAAKCDRCPNCREKIMSIGKIFLPPELRVATHTQPAAGAPIPVPDKENSTKKCGNLELSTTV